MDGSSRALGLCSENRYKGFAVLQTMVNGTAYLVFALPVAFTVVLGSIVLITALDELDREINMWPDGDASAHSSGGIATTSSGQAYAGSSTSEIQTRAGDPLLDCAYPEAIIRDFSGDLFGTDIGESACLEDELFALNGFAVAGGVL